MEERDMLIAAITKLDNLQNQITEWREEDRFFKREICTRLSLLEEWKSRQSGEYAEAKKHEEIRQKLWNEKLEKLTECLEEQLPIIRESHAFVRDSKRLFMTALTAVISAGINIILTLYYTMNGR